MAQVEKLLIFLASPGDATIERRYVHEVVNELNSTVASSKGLTLQVVSWEKDAYPGYGMDAQFLINLQIAEMAKYSLFVGIMWNRLGTPTPRAASGTVEEFERAVAASAQHGQPDIWFYFRQTPAKSPTPDQLEQSSRVRLFEKHVRANGLPWNYKSRSEFKDQFRRQLINWLITRTQTEPLADLKSNEKPIIGIARSLRFNDYLTSDPVSVKLAVKQFDVGERSFTITWPSEHEELFATVKRLLADAEQYHLPESVWFGGNQDFTLQYVENATSSIKYANYIRSNIHKRITLLLEGMKDYWSSSNVQLERSLSNFLTLANYTIQRRLAYTLRLKPIYDKHFPHHWDSWFADNMRFDQDMASLFQIEEPIYKARVDYIADMYYGQYSWGPKSMILEARDRYRGKAILNPWFVKYLIPQVELLRIGDSRVVPYREEALVNKVLDERYNEI